MSELIVLNTYILNNAVQCGYLLPAEQVHSYFYASIIKYEINTDIFMNAHLSPCLASDNYQEKKHSKVIFVMQFTNQSHSHFPILKTYFKGIKVICKLPVP